MHMSCVVTTVQSNVNVVHRTVDSSQHSLVLEQLKAKIIAQGQDRELWHNGLPLEDFCTLTTGLLYSYHRTLVLDLIAKSNGELVKSLTKPQVLLRFTSFGACE